MSDPSDEFVDDIIDSKTFANRTKDREALAELHDLRRRLREP